MDRSVKRVRCGVIGGGGWARWGGPDRCGISPSQHTRHERTCKVHRSLVPCVNPTPGYPLLSASQPPRNCGLPSCADVCGEDRGGSVRSMRRSINRPGRGRVGATQPLRHAPSCQRTCDVRTHVRVHIWIDAVAAAHTDRCQDGGTRRLAMSSAGPSTRNRLVWVDWASRFKGGAPVERDSSASSSFTPGGPLKKNLGRRAAHRPHRAKFDPSPKRRRTIAWAARANGLPREASTASLPKKKRREERGPIRRTRRRAFQDTPDYYTKNRAPDEPSKGYNSSFSRPLVRTTFGMGRRAVQPLGKP